ncbi:MAG: type III-A CRISPR-associated protein Csm2 [Abditibacteriales bacterium]|nr:type III-A CRISPR-associated protein Csm2 [Abditibacteriales bacterium]MDW8365485.1 type III-A CRISPR-associated protein Csm2 [Abditibacteriales bacterium]
MANMQTVLNTIKGKKAMSELRPEEFALEGGLADQVVLSFGGTKRKIKEALKPTQLRKVFHTLKEIQQEVKAKDKSGKFDSTKLLRLTPELAYATGRELLPRDFYLLLRECLDPKRLPTNADFLRAFDFVEAILAYHKYRSEIGVPGKEQEEEDES